MMSAPSPDPSIPAQAETIAQLPFFAAGRFPKPDLLGQCRNGAVTSTSGRAMVEWVRDFSLGLATLGMKAGDRVALLSESRVEWLIADFAVVTAGAVTTPIYPTLSVEQIQYIVNDSGASLMIVSSGTQLAKALAIVPAAPTLRAIVVFDEGTDLPQSQIPVISLRDVSARGHDRIRAGWGVAKEFHDAALRVRPDDLATIIYTSGTTGPPKGVMLTHGNLSANVAGVVRVLDLHHEDVGLSFLPLCHAFERIVAYVYMTTGVSMVFAESIETVPRDLQTVRPTVMSAFPRVFEKLYARVMERGEAEGGLKRMVFRRAVSAAKVRGARLAERKSLPPVVAMASPLFERLVYKAIRAGMGGRLRFVVSGSAPLNPELGRFFYGVGLPILEGYGLTEASPALCLNPPGEVRMGTVGPALPNVELRLAADGEILARGPNIMAGYFRQPEATALVLADGWLHTGDIGTLDERGYLRLTDRKKEMIVTSGGKKIAPQPIEERLRQHRLIHQAVLIGDRRHFPAALIVPDAAVLRTALGLAPTASITDAVAESRVRAWFQEAVDDANRELAQYERVKKFALLPDALTIETGELTPTLKVKRRVVEERYRAVIDALYVG